MQLFSERSIWTMIHGVGLGGGALVTSFAMLFFLLALRTSVDASGAQMEYEARWFTWLAVVTVILLWLAVILGTYVTFPPYRATPPEGVTDLSAYPRQLIRSDPSTAWLHSFAMEMKEHVPWIAAMVATPVAFVSVRYGSRLLADKSLRSVATTLTAICVVLVAIAAILGTLVNKVAPLH